MSIMNKLKAFMVLRRAISLLSEREQTLSLVGGIKIVSAGLFAGCSALPVRGRKIEIRDGEEVVLEGVVWDGAYADAPPSIMYFKDGDWTSSIRPKHVLS